MKTQRFHALSVLAAGVLVLLVTVLVLFWARLGCESARYGLLPEQARQIKIDASSLLSPKAGRDPNVPLHFTLLMRPQEVSKMLYEGLIGLRRDKRWLDRAKDKLGKASQMLRIEVDRHVKASKVDLKSRG